MLPKKYSFWSILSIFEPFGLIDDMFMTKDLNNLNLHIGDLLMPKIIH